MKNLKIFNTTVLDGTLDFKSFINDYACSGFGDLSFDDKKKEIKRLKKKFNERKIIVGREYGFDGKKLIVVNDSNNYNGGKYKIVNGCKDYDKDDLRDVRTSCDIVLLRKDDSGLVVAAPASDDPIIIIEDEENEVTALSHCNMEKISAELPIHMVDALKKEVNSNIKNLKVYISPCLKRTHNAHFLKPKTIVENPKIWKGCVSHGFVRNVKIYTSKQFLYYLMNAFEYKINEEKAISNMFVRKGLRPENISISEEDTFKSVNLFSKRNSEYWNEPLLDGKFLVGAFYQVEENSDKKKAVMK